MKTPEELAEEYAESVWSRDLMLDHDRISTIQDFLAGYAAAIKQTTTQENYETNENNKTTKDN
jgi:hypothetical protein